MAIRIKNGATDDDIAYQFLHGDGKNGGPKGAFVDLRKDDRYGDSIGERNQSEVKFTRTNFKVCFAD